MNSSILHIDNGLLDKLDSTSAVRLFRSLLWCEAKRCGLSPHKIVISLRTNVGDGGIDARVNGTLGTDSVLMKGVSYFQIKTGGVFKPWQRSALLKELFGNPKATPDREMLAPGIVECLEKQGRYVVVSFGHDLTPNQQYKAKDLLRELLLACGYKSPRLDVLGQSQLTGLIGTYPSLMLDIVGHRDTPFLTIETWKSRDDMLPALQLADPQSKFIGDILGALRERIYQHVRVIGEPGIGKTRLVLEALSADDLAPMVLYTLHAEDFQQSRLFNELISEDETAPVILVIDECDERQRASIWGAVKGKKGIRLITIDHGPERSSDQDMLLLQCPRLPDAGIEAIMASYLEKQVGLSHWVSWCDGSPRVAHAVGENLRSRPKDLLKPPATVPMWERFIAGYDRLDSRNAQDALTVMRHIALFSKFGFQNPVSSEAKYIATLVQAADPSITWQRFQEIVERLWQRRILQGRRTLFIVPKALHIYLWVDYWNNYGRGFHFREFFAEVPSELKRWFLELFIYAHVSPVAHEVVADILGQAGPFSDREFLVSEPGCKFLNYLAEADPGATLRVLERNFGTWTLEALRQWTSGRQHIVWALEKIAVWREHFQKVAELLVKLALAENATYSNNATGILEALFMIGVGWAPTQASPEQRFPILQQLLDSPDRQRRELGLLLVRKWLSTHGGIRTVGAEFQGLRPEIEFWSPRVWGDVFDAWRQAWRHLYSISRSWSDDQRRLANTTLIEAGRSLLSQANIANEVLETFIRLTDDPATDRRILTHAIIEKLRVRNERMPKGIRKGLRSLDDAVTGKTFWERFCRYVLNTSWDEDYTVTKEGVKQLDKAPRRVESLVREVVRRPSLFTEHVSRFVAAEGHRLFQFGFQLAHALNSQRIIEEVVSAQLLLPPGVQMEFTRGYFSGLKDSLPIAWESRVMQLLDDPSSRDVGTKIVYRCAMSESVLKRLLVFLKAASAQAYVFGGLWLTAERDEISPSVIEEVVSCLRDSNTQEALAVAIELTSYYFFSKERPKSCDEGLLFRLITADKFFQDNPNQMVGYHWCTVTNGFRQRFRDRDMEILSVIMSHPECLIGSRSRSDPITIADAIVRDHKAEAWTVVSAALENDDSYYSVACWLGDEFEFEKRRNGGAIRFFDPVAVMSWVINEPAARARRLIRCLGKTLAEGEGGLLTKLFLEQFGDDDALAGSLIAHFLTGGWTGPESIHFSKKRDEAREWISAARSGKALSWLYRYIDYLNERVEQAELEEERRF